MVGLGEGRFTIRCKIVNSSDIKSGECMHPARFLGVCHESCQRVDRCKHHEAAKARLILAKRKLADLEACTEAQRKRVEALQEEWEKVAPHVVIE